MGNVTKLAYFRTKKGYTQKRLSEVSKVSYRMIFGYEQGTKDINKANAFTLFRLAAALDCTIEDLLEIEKEDTNE